MPSAEGHPAAASHPSREDTLTVIGVFLSMPSSRSFSSSRATRYTSIKYATFPALINATTSAVASCKRAMRVCGDRRIASKRACLSGFIRWSGSLCRTSAGHHEGLPASPLL